MRYSLACYAPWGYQRSRVVLPRIRLGLSRLLEDWTAPVRRGGAQHHQDRSALV